MFVTEPEESIIQAYRGAGGDGPGYAEVPMAWAEDADAAAQEALETSRWSLTGWKVMSELPNPVNFEAASSTVTLDDIRGQFSCGPDLDAHVPQFQPYVDAGYDRLVVQNVGPDQHAFLDAAASDLIARVRALRPAT